MISFQFGVGLRPTHHSLLEDLIESRQLDKVKLDFFEIISENFIHSNSRAKDLVLKLRENFDFAMHGVSMSIGRNFSSPKDVGFSEWDLYLNQLYILEQEIKPKYLSDHLCFSQTSIGATHELLPIMRTEENLKNIVNNILYVQEKLKRNILLENISYYFDYAQNTMSEVEFINEIVKQSGCRLLFDINNLYVNSYNFNFNAKDYLVHLNLNSIEQLHLGGASWHENFLYDTHSSAVSDPVWDLYRIFIEKFKFNEQNLAVLLERDDQIPDFWSLQEEALLAKQISKECF